MKLYYLGIIDLTPMPKEKIKALKIKLGFKNNNDFGALFPVSGRIIEHWISGHRKPGKVTLRILNAIAKQTK